MDRQKSEPWTKETIQRCTRSAQTLIHGLYKIACVNSKNSRHCNRSSRHLGHRDKGTLPVISLYLSEFNVIRASNAANLATRFAGHNYKVVDQLPNRAMGV